MHATDAFQWRFPCDATLIMFFPVRIPRDASNWCLLKDAPLIILTAMPLNFIFLSPMTLPRQHHTGPSQQSSALHLPNSHQHTNNSPLKICKLSASLFNAHKTYFQQGKLGCLAEFYLEVTFVELVENVERPALRLKGRGLSKSGIRSFQEQHDGSFWSDATGFPKSNTTGLFEVKRQVFNGVTREVFLKWHDRSFWSEATGFPKRDVKIQRKRDSKSIPKSNTTSLPKREATRFPQEFYGSFQEMREFLLRARADPVRDMTFQFADINHRCLSLLPLYGRDSRECYAMKEEIPTKPSLRAP